MRRGPMQSTPVQAVQDWGDAFMASLTSALSLFLAAIPWEKWYARGQQAAPKVERAADAARDWHSGSGLSPRLV